MSSVQDDRAARARIRDTAIDLFSREGFDVSVRRIAEHAGVSAALVIHHFGSKAGLRDACDAHVLVDYVTGKDLGQESMRQGGTLGVFASLGQYGPLLGYLRHTIREGGEPARRIVEAMVADADSRTPAAISDGTLTASPDDTARNRFLVLSTLSTVALYDLIDPDPTPPRSGAELIERMSDDIFLPMLEVYSHGYLRTPALYEAFAQSRRGARPPEPEPEPDAPSGTGGAPEPPGATASPSAAPTASDEGDAT